MKLHKISETNCDVYVTGDYLNGNYMFCGFILKKDPKTYYHSLVGFSEILSIPEGCVAVDIGTYILNFYNQLAHDELQAKIKESVRVYDFTQMESDYEYNRFWHNAIHEAGKEIRLYKIGGIIAKQEDGMITLSFYEDSFTFENRIEGVYDFKENRHIRYQVSNDNTPLDITTLDIAHVKVNMNKLIALEQYKLEIAPKAYNELATINKFIENAEKIIFVLKNGKKGTYSKAKKRVSPFMADYNEDDGKMDFYLYRALATKKCVPMNELNFIQVGKKKHYIDASAFDMPDRIKDKDKIV